MSGAGLEQILPPRSGPAHPDWWGMWDIERGGRVHCGTFAAFVGYLLSPSTHRLSVGPVSPGPRTVQLYAYGPRCDDGRRMFVSYLLRAEEWEEAPAQQRAALMAAAEDALSAAGLAQLRNVLRAYR